MTTDSKAVCGGGENQTARWLPIETAPTDRPVVVRQRTDSLQGGWFVATVTLPDPDAEEGRFHGSSTILHYNGTFLMGRFYGTWTHWLCDEPAALASTAGAGAGDCSAQMIEALKIAEAVQTLGYTQKAMRSLQARGIEPPADCWWSSLSIQSYVKNARRSALKAAEAMIEAAPAVPASPRSGAGEGEEKDWRDRALTNAERLIVFATYHSAKLGQALTDELMEFAAEWQGEVEASSQGGGAGRSEKGEGEEGRVTSSPGSRADAPSPSVSASGFDPSRGSGLPWQVAEQCRVVAHLASALARVHLDYVALCEVPAFADILPQVGQRSAALMEQLADVLNSMDALSDRDAWTRPIFEEAQRLYPAHQPAPAQSPSTSDREG